MAYVGQKAGLVGGVFLSLDDRFWPIAACRRKAAIGPIAAIHGRQISAKSRRSEIGGFSLVSPSLYALASMLF